MDPTKALNDLMRAIMWNEKDKAADIAADLEGWFRTGGFTPHVEHVELTHGNRDDETTYVNNVYRVSGK